LGVLGVPDEPTAFEEFWRIRVVFCLVNALEGVVGGLELMPVFYFSYLFSGDLVFYLESAIGDIAPSFLLLIYSENFFCPLDAKAVTPPSIGVKVRYNYFSFVLS
jgi:hypothetical protein